MKQHDLTIEIAGLDPLRNVAVSAGAILLLRPAVEMMGQAETGVAFAGAVKNLLRAALGDFSWEHLEISRHVLMNCPESVCDDSNSPKFMIMMALATADDALRDVLEGIRPAKRACDSVLHFFGSMDISLDHALQGVIKKNSAKIESKAELKAAESICDIVGICKKMEASAAEISECALQKANELKPYLESYRRVRGWQT